MAKKNGSKQLSGDDAGQLLIALSVPATSWFVVGTRIDPEQLQQQVVERLLCDCREGECRRLEIEANPMKVGNKDLIGVGIRCYYNWATNKQKAFEIAEEKATKLRDRLGDFGIQSRIQLSPF